MKELRVRQYRLLRTKGYTASAALWNVRHCSNYFWQQQMFGIRHNYTITR